MTFNYKTRIDPKTGRAETYCDGTDDQAAADKLARDKRELRDMLAGNTPFHVDPNAAPLPVPEARELPPIEFEWPNLTPGYVYVMAELAELAAAELRINPPVIVHPDGTWEFLRA